jgi:hypothetical protein
MSHGQRNSVNDCNLKRVSGLTPCFLNYYLHFYEGHPILAAGGIL